MSDEVDPLQLSMIGINPATAYLLLNRYVSLMPGDWIGQTAANSAMGQYIIALAKLAGVKTLNVVRREESATQVRQFGGDRVVIQGDNLHKDIEEVLDGKKLSLVLDTVGGTPVGELAKSLKDGGSIVVYALQSGQFPAFSPRDFIYHGLSLHGFWLINWIRNAPRTESQEIYQKLGDLVADGSLFAAVEHVYPLEQFKEAFKHSLKSNRSGNPVQVWRQSIGACRAIVSQTSQDNNFQVGGEQTFFFNEKGLLQRLDYVAVGPGAHYWPGACRSYRNAPITSVPTASPRQSASD